MNQETKVDFSNNTTAHSKPVKQGNRHIDKKQLKSLGRHMLADLHGCDLEIISSQSQMRELLLEAARISGATIVTDVFHTFNPHGVSGVVVIAESHIAVHTWPEHLCVSLDFFSCSDKMNIHAALNYLSTSLKCRSSDLRIMDRGLLVTP